MRSLSLLVIASALGSCAADGPIPVRQVASPRTMEWLLGGKVAGPPVRCLADYQRRDMTVLDSETIAFRDGGRRTYVMKLSPGCGQLASGGGALVTRSFGTSDLCTGDIARVLDTSSRMIAGSCSIGPITPYERPRT
jgi:hypothetical protein